MELEQERKPRVFIGSSKEAAHYVNAIHGIMSGFGVEVTPWTTAFTITNYTMEDLERQLDQNDFAIFVCSPDDIIEIRDKKYFITRDNTLFELGLFWGKLRRGRVFYLIPNIARNIEVDGEENKLDYRLLTDLLGITYTAYEIRNDNNYASAVSVACGNIHTVMRQKGLFNDPYNQLKVIQTKYDELSLQRKESEVVAKFNTVLSTALLRMERTRAAEVLASNLQRAHSVPKEHEIDDVGVWKVEGTDGLRHIIGEKPEIDFYEFGINTDKVNDKILVIESYTTSQIIFIKKSSGVYNTYLICYPITNSMVITVTFSSKMYGEQELTEDEKDFLLERNKRLMITINELFGGVSV